MNTHPKGKQAFYFDENDLRTVDQVSTHFLQTCSLMAARWTAISDRLVNTTLLKSFWDSILLGLISYGYFLVNPGLEPKCFSWEACTLLTFIYKELAFIGIRPNYYLKPERTVLLRK